MGLNRPIDITTDQRKTVLALLASHLPNTTAWVYGSRVKWTARPESDLDLVVFATPEQTGRVSNLREAFEESDLPFRVDLFVWAEVPEQFRKQIEAEHVVLVEREEHGIAGEWLAATIDDIAASSRNALVGGPFGSNLVSRDYVSEGVPVIRGQNMGTRWVTGNFVFVTPQKAKSLEANLARPADIVLTQRGTLGQVSIVPSTSFSRYLVSQSQMKVTVDREIADPLFFYYVLSSSEQQDYVRQNTIQTGVPHTNLGILRSTPVPLPPLSEQQSIAHILGTLDDKIELNRRMNQTLEEMARALFKSWFVDFNPVHAKATLKHESTPPQRGSDWSVERARAYLDRMDPNIAALFPDRFVDSELGPIPEGWEVKDLGESFILTMGQSPPGSTYNEQGEGLPFFQGRSDFGFRYPENRKFCTAPTRIAQPGDSLVSVRAPVGDINMAWEKCCIGRGVAALRHKSGTISFSYYSAWTIQAALREYEQTGTVFGAINKSQFEALRVIEPSPSIVDAFASCARPLDAKIRSNIAESRIVAAFRDALLPKLVSGDVRAKQMEMATP